MCKLVAKHAKLRVRSIIGGRRKRLQTDSLESGVDLIIATPGRLQQLKDAGDVFYSELRHLVIDEADSMFGKGSIEDTRAVLGPIHVRSCSRRATLLESTLADPARDNAGFDCQGHTRGAVGCSECNDQQQDSQHAHDRVWCT